LVDCGNFEVHLIQMTAVAPIALRVDDTPDPSPFVIHLVDKRAPGECAMGVTAICAN
jgi:hypothetical protein